MTPATASPASEPKTAGFAAWAGFTCMCLGMFMAILDVQIVATSLPTIQAALRIAPDRMVWIQTAYLTAEIVAIPLTGYLTDVLGMRRLFVGAVSLFTLASIGCAMSGSFESLILWRVVQGFSGGTLIPIVFSAVFLLFPVRVQGLATTIAGVAAVLAPTIGPIIGGWVTQSFSWHWLFRINIVPGIVAALGVAWLLRGQAAVERSGTRRSIDIAALVLLAAALVALQIGLKDAPTRGWGDARVLGLLAVFVACGGGFVVRTWRAAVPLVELRCFADRNFAIGCLFSFVLGFGLFGSTYLMPFFLGLVREHGALRIGEIMLVTGIAQLVSAPIAVWAERRVDPRWLTAFGFGLFAIGLLMSMSQTAQTDFHAMILPQVVRGAAIMFCLLPPTRMALGRLPRTLVADGSGLFNLMRNLGGAVGLALVDTMIFSRAATEGRHIASRLQAGDLDTALRIGIPKDAFLEQRGQPLDDFAVEMVRPLVEKAALVPAVNAAWAMCGVLTAIVLLAVLWVRRTPVE
ncbi:DHA2 family efflux MFS transporter permease subunit [Sphingomonas yabuuchiae]|uniref:DHA2 family efflux MFS transporter permease subunit n=1 Tax=Sphingomonas yabuuchiae TaxID=172044 RepID=A0AA40ZW00_9SPHN|nr:DHA2 family efflux MFS transporter permease subunit [Sphingomonas yabuuchiae]MBB4611226.1 DHA2 family multidrug resistance protein [Sphingomonas yabuuchiae]MBN3557135.1 DHA2 family efflux MFS transporter permease subunit [Sphingomonas yabuuchiae]